MTLPLTWTEGQIVIDWQRTTERSVRCWETIPSGARMKWRIIEHSLHDYRVSLGMAGPGFANRGYSWHARDIWVTQDLQSAMHHVERQYQVSDETGAGAGADP